MDDETGQDDFKNNIGDTFWLIRVYRGYAKVKNMYKNNSALKNFGRFSVDHDDVYNNNSFGKKQNGSSRRTLVSEICGFRRVIFEQRENISRVTL